MKTRATWAWMIVTVACGGSGSETPPPVEPIAPAWTDRESDTEPAGAGQPPAAATPTEREESNELAPPEDAE